MKSLGAIADNRRNRERRDFLLRHLRFETRHNREQPSGHGRYVRFIQGRRRERTRHGRAPPVRVTLGR